MKKIISLLLVFTFGLSSCEKDDICDASTPTTPRLVIKFFSSADPSTPRSVTNLRVIGIGPDADPNGIVFNESGTTTTKYLANGNTISIPLKVDEDTTSYRFILDSDDPNPDVTNSDIITFNYTRQTSYVSRACGFKTIFMLNEQTTADPNTSGYIRTDDPDTGDGVWMKTLNLKTRNIELENETHLEILF